MLIPPRCNNRKSLALLLFHLFFFCHFLYLLIQFHSQTCGSLLPSSGQLEHQQRSSSRCVKITTWMTSVIKQCFPPLAHYVLCRNVFSDPLIIHTYLLLLFLAMHAELVHLCISYWEAQWERNRVGVAQGDLSQLCLSCAQKINIEMIDFSLRQRDRIVTLIWKMLLIIQTCIRQKWILKDPKRSLTKMLKKTNNCPI